MKKILILFLSVLLLFSCASKPNYEELYQNQKYDEIIEASSERLKTKLDKTSLFYRMLSYYSLNRFDEVAGDAALYVLLYSDERDEALKTALMLSVVFLDNTEASLILSENYELSRGEMELVFTSLMRGGKPDAAEALYSKVRGELTGEEAANLLIDAKASSVAILQELEEWKRETNDALEVELAIYKCVPLFTSRGEAALLIPLMNEIYEETNSNYSALILGDLYSSNGSTQKARVYWNIARESYPASVERRLNSLRP